MHMADALVAPAVAATMYVCSGGAAGFSVKKVRLESDPKKIPVMGVMGAFVFAAQMINFTIPGTGSSGHLCGGMMLTALLGPYAAFLTMIGVLLIQCLLFADGGLLALGCNIWNMAFYGCFLGYFGIDTPIDSTEGKKLFAALADEMLDKKHPAVYNQGIMDFGAIQCTPQSPNCLFCPLAGGCSALSKGLVTKLPVKQHKTKTTNRYFNYIYVRAGAYTFINKRTADDIWKNLFELPLIETSVALSEEEFLALPEFRELVAEGEKPVVVRSVCREVKHVLSHRVIYANFYEVTLPAESASFGNYRKIKAEELGQYAVPRLVHAFIEKYVDSK